MNYQITSDNIELSESMKALVMDKMSSFETKLTEEELATGNARVVLNKAAAEAEFRVKIEMNIKGEELFATEKDFSIDAALINAVKEIGRLWEKSTSPNEKDWKIKRDLKRSPEMFEE